MLGLREFRTIQLHGNIGTHAIVWHRCTSRCTEYHKPQNCKRENRTAWLYDFVQPLMFVQGGAMAALLPRRRLVALVAVLRRV